MKKTAVKKVAAVVLTVLMMFAVSLNAFAETWQDRLEQALNGYVDDYNNADPESQKNMQEEFDKFIKDFGLDEIDLGALSETDIGQIVTGIGDNLALDSFLGLAGDAFSSGMAMLEDVFNKGSGTSDGSNTAKPPVTSPNIIIADPVPESSNVAVGVPEQNLPTLNAPSSGSTEPTTAGNMVGAGVTTPNTTAPQVVIDDQMNTSSTTVLIVMCVSTIAVIMALVIFFIFKKK